MTGPLKAPCKEHGMYDAHPTSSGFGDYSKPPLVFDCPGGTVLPEDTLVSVWYCTSHFNLGDEDYCTDLATVQRSCRMVEGLLIFPEGSGE